MITAHTLPCTSCQNIVIGNEDVAHNLFHVFVCICAILDICAFIDRSVSNPAYSIERIILLRMLGVYRAVGSITALYVAVRATTDGRNSNDGYK